MFTGIIHITAPIFSIVKKTNLYIHTIKLPINLIKNLKIGSSISYNGCCLTIANINNNLVSFEIIQETLNITNISILNEGDIVNLERSVSFNTEVGGHLMNGHIICTAILDKIIYTLNNRKIWFKINIKKMKKYLIYKGSIGIDGISLTICQITNEYFCVALIPKTLKSTNIGFKKPGDILNIEIDLQTRIIIDSIERIMLNNRN